MRYGSASIVCAFSLGIGWILAGGCGGSTSSEFPSTGTGVLTGTGGGLTTGGNSTGTGTISTGTIGSGTGSTGTGGIGSEDACAAQASDTAAIPSDIFIMLDKSGSMNCPAADDACENPRMPFMPPTRWNAVTDAINTFVNAPGSAGIGVGLGFFSLGTSCNAAMYAMPNVAIAPLPGNANAITNAIAMNMPGGNTPTVPALQGAIQYANTYTRNTPGRTAAVVFVTDGLPNGCNSTINAATMAATAAFNAMPQIKTYVIGLGATASLDEIALAGSGGVTHYFPATGNVAANLAAALKTISGSVSCDYVIPTTAVDPNKVNVEVTVGGGMTQLVGKVANAAACGAQGGWFYDVNPPGVPTKITLCPQSCTPLQMTPNSRVVVQYGCPSRGPGVN